MKRSIAATFHHLNCNVTYQDTIEANQDNIGCSNIVSQSKVNPIKSWCDHIIEWKPPTQTHFKVLPEKLVR